MKKIVLIVLLTISVALQVQGHGYLIDPPNRSSLWRFNPDSPINYDDNANYCGGAAVQHGSNGGKCGICGDNYADPQPRANENGGYYGQGIVTRTYHEGTNMQIHVNVTASHGGHFEFNICDLAKSNPESEECFNEHPLIQLDGTLHYNITKDIDYSHGHVIYLRLPEHLTCERCVLRWHWRAGNSYGTCEDGTIQLGCGNQETFRNCADIAIVPRA